MANFLSSPNRAHTKRRKDTYVTCTFTAIKHVLTHESSVNLRPRNKTEKKKQKPFSKPQQKNIQTYKQTNTYTNNINTSRKDFPFHQTH